MAVVEDTLLLSHERLRANLAITFPLVALTAISTGDKIKMRRTTAFGSFGATWGKAQQEKKTTVDS